MGECPEDYALIQYAKYLNCKPWELMEQSIWWRIRASQFMTAESSARKILDARNNNK